MTRKAQQSESAAVLTETVVIPPGTPEWITVELIRLTLKVWQKRYSRPLSIQDAVTIVLNAERLFGVLARE